MRATMAEFPSDLFKDANLAVLAVEAASEGDTGWMRLIRPVVPSSLGFERITIALRAFDAPQRYAKELQQAVQGQSARPDFWRQVSNQLTTL